MILIKMALLTSFFFASGNSSQCNNRPPSTILPLTVRSTPNLRLGDHFSLVPIVSQEAPYHQFDFQIPKTANVEITSQLFHGTISNAEFSVMIDDCNELINDEFTEISKTKKNKGEEKKKKEHRRFNFVSSF